jgi:Fur family transcriptional regulator, ferric uptake regulator
MILRRIASIGPVATAEAPLRDRLAAKGVRATRQRLLVLGVLAGERDDATAQEIHRRLRETGEAVGLATVYRTLAVLADHGVVDLLAHHRGEACYRLCGEEHHHHLVCSECQRVVELEECELDGWIDDVAAAHGWVAREHRLEVSGLCADCR